MRELSQNELLQVNGGATYFYCRLCGYTSYNYFDVYSHVLVKEMLPAAVNIVKLFSTTSK